MKLWRIAVETRQYKALDLSGNGAANKPGRWNDQSEPVIYCAPTLAMAALETVAYVDDGGLPLNRFVIEIDVPNAIWATREELNVLALDPAWEAIPAGQTSIRIGSDWIKSARSLILMVPSVIVPEEHCTLINPHHPDASHIKARTVRRFEYNRIFRKN